LYVRENMSINSTGRHGLKEGSDSSMNEQDTSKKLNKGSIGQMSSYIIDDPKDVEDLSQKIF
jgi:hypothetical protein